MKTRTKKTLTLLLMTLILPLVTNVKSTEAIFNDVQYFSGNSFTAGYWESDTEEVTYLEVIDIEENDGGTLETEGGSEPVLHDDEGGKKEDIDSKDDPLKENEVEETNGRFNRNESTYSEDIDKTEEMIENSLKNGATPNDSDTVNAAENEVIIDNKGEEQTFILDLKPETDYEIGGEGGKALENEGEDGSELPESHSDSTNSIENTEISKDRPQEEGGNRETTNIDSTDSDILSREQH